MDLLLNIVYFLPHIVTIITIVRVFPNLETWTSRQEAAKLQWLSPEKTVVTGAELLLHVMVEPSTLCVKVAISLPETISDE